MRRDYFAELALFLVGPAVLIYLFIYDHMRTIMNSYTAVHVSLW